MDSSSSEFFFEQNDLLIESMPILQEFRKTGLFCDVVVKAGDRKFLAHRNILATTIPYFYTMFTSEYMESKQREILIQNIDPSTLEVLIDFSYSGKIQIDPQNIEKLMSAADFFQLNQVKNACADYLESKIEAENVFEIIKLSDMLDCQQLVSAADEFVNENFSDISRSNEFLMLEFEELEELISKDDLCCSEETVFEAAMKWVKHKEIERESFLPEILSKVKFLLVSTEYLMNVVSTEKLITASLECLQIVDKAKNDRMLLGENVLIQRSRNLSKFSNLVPIITKNQLKFYDLIKNEWLDGELLNENRSSFAIESIGCKIYVIGGSGSYNNNVDIYDLETRKWSRGENMLNGRSHMRSTSLNDCIYVCGGRQGSNDLSSVDCYSTKENSWKAVAPMIIQRQFVGVTSFNEQIYAFGGFNNEQCALSSCEKYDPISNTWTYIEPLWCKRYNPGVATLNNKIYVCGGYDNGSLNSCEVYDPSLDSWEFVPPMKEKRFGFSLKPFNGKLYAVGSNVNNDIAAIEIYCPETNSWQML